MFIKENGRSMVEMLGVLAIVGILSAGALVGYSKAIYKIKLNKSIEQLMSISLNIQALLKQGEVLTINNQTLKFIVPENMWQGSKILTALKQEVQISDISWNGMTDGEAIMVELPFMIASPKICIDLSNINWENSGADSYAILVGDTLTAYGDDWTVDGFYSEDAYFASNHGHSLLMPVSVDISSKICEHCSENTPCTFGMFFEENLR